MIRGAIATCTLTINSDVPGTFEATARATIDLGTVVAEIITNGRGNNSRPVVKEYYIPAAIGDRVFGDSNPHGETPSEIMAGNGIQDEGEQGVDGIFVQLYDDEDLLVGETVTENGGYYEFTELPPGDYYVVFINPLGEGLWTIANIGLNDEIDSDVDPFLELTIETGILGDAVRTELVTLEQGEFDRSWDGGLVGLSTAGSSALGDRVWLDIDEDGIQGDTALEYGLVGVTVRLYSVEEDQSLVLQRESLTDENGDYLFEALNPGSYIVDFVLPGDYSVSPLNSGLDRAMDSDADAQSGRTALITLPAYMVDRTWDAGIFSSPTAIEGGDEPEILLDNYLYLPFVRR